MWAGLAFVADCRNNLTCCRKEIKEKILIWILRTLYVQVKGVSSMAAGGRKSTEIRNRILMMKMRQAVRGGGRGGEGEAMCSLLYSYTYSHTDTWNFLIAL